MDSPSIDTNSRPNSPAKDCHDVATIELTLPGATLAGMCTTSDDGYPFAGKISADCRTVLLSESNLFRDALKQMLQNSRISVIGDGHDIAGLLATMQTQPIPELVICHIASDRNNEAASDLLGTLRQHFTRAKLVVLADACTRSLLSSFVSEDVNAILLTSISGEMLLRSLELVLLGHCLFPDEIMSLIKNNALRKPDRDLASTESLITFARSAIPGHSDQVDATLPIAAPSEPQLRVTLSEREPHDSPHLSDRPENVCEERLLVQHLGEALHQRTQPGFRHHGD
jgi:DNA-binding NarL/FixJ family response regulator